MRKNYKFTSILTILFLAVSLTLSAQMSDEQVLQELQRYEGTGLSPQQIQLRLSRQGVTPAQLQRVMERQDVGNVDNITVFEQIEGFRDDADIPVITIQAPVINPEDRIFGQHFFSAENLTFAPNMNMPTPANYVLGAGDEVIIDVWGHSELNISRTIAPDGHIIIPGIGRIHLSGLSVQRAESYIRNRLATIYSDLVSYSPQTFMEMSVGNVRTIRVNVMGEVVTPGSFVLSSFATAFHALHVSGGPNNIGSLRNIEVIRNGNIVATIDLYEYLMNSGSAGNITLRDDDMVRVNPHGILTQIVGEVRRPMWYEMREDETLADLIRFAGGFSGNAYQANLALHRRGATEMEAFTLNEREFDAFNLHDGDIVSVGSILERFANMVEISGAIYRPGTYAIGNEIRTVRDLVNIAHGPMGDAHLQRVQLRRQQDDLREIIESFSLADLMSGRIPDIVLQRNDRLHIPSIFSLEDDITVSISGEVRFPDTFRFVEHMHLEDLILLAGGLTDAASTAQIDVFRRMRDPASISPSAEIGEEFSFSLRDGEIMLRDTVFALAPFDQVIVRRSPSYEEQQIVTVRGEVLFEGQYVRLRRDERLSSFIGRAGGLIESAFPAGARLYREMTEAERRRTRDAIEAAARAAGDTDMSWIDELDFDRQLVSINLELALRNPGSEHDIILLEGDELLIPVNPGTVRISGGVMFPNTVIYNSRMNLNAYVRQAGGFTRLAMRNRAYVVHMNGQVSTGRWTTITPGSEIVIPERPPREQMSMQGLVGISTSLATLALVIMNILR